MGAMSELLDRRLRPYSALSRWRGTPWLAGPVAAVRAAATSLFLVVVVVLLAWAAAHSAAAPAAVVRIAAATWLVAHHADLLVGGERLGIAPLGLLALPGWCCLSAARRAARWTVRSPVDALVMVATMTAAYGGLAALVAALSATPQVRPATMSAGLGAATLAALAAGAASWPAWGRRAGLGSQWRALAAGALAGVAALVAAGGLLAGAAVAVHGAEVTQVARVVAPDAVGGLFLALLGAAFVPNAALWGVAYAVGPGFAVGVVTAVSPLGVRLGDLPQFPLLAALPDNGPAPPLALFAAMSPLCAGALVAVVTVRRAAPGSLPSPRRAALVSAAAGAAAGLALGVLTGLSGGPLAGGHYMAVGPSGWLVGVAAALETGPAAALVAWAWCRRKPGEAVSP